MTDFQKVVSKPLAGYHHVVWAKFHKINDILTVIRNKSRASRLLCQVLETNIEKFSKAGSVIVSFHQQ